MGKDVTISDSKISSESRAKLISTVQTPLGFFSLVVLIVEAVLGSVAALSSGIDRTWLVIGMLALIFLLVVIVASMAIFRPKALYGIIERISTESEVSTDKPNKVSEPIVVHRPNVLAASAMNLYTLAEVSVLKQAFPRSKIDSWDNIAAPALRSVLSQRKYDLVELTVGVTPDGDLDFGHVEQRTNLIPGDGLVELLELSGVKLLVLTCCFSVPLAAKLAGRVNMIAATGSLDDGTFHEWRRIFLELLSKGNRMSTAFSAATRATRLPISMFMAHDVIFSS